MSHSHQSDVVILFFLAWADNDGDGNFDLGAEDGFFAVKNIEGTDYIITKFSYSGNDPDYYYLVPYNDGGIKYAELEEIGAGGFNFTIE